MLNFSKFQLADHYQVLDCLKNADLDKVKDGLTRFIPVHGSKLYRFSE